MIERSDADHLDFATAAGRVLCSYNVSDFWMLHSERLTAGTGHAGMILMPRQRYGPGEQLRRLLSIATTQTTETMLNRAEFLSAWEPTS